MRRAARSSPARSKPRRGGKLVQDDLGERMKAYESVPRTRLVRRVPVMMRLDGKAFHTFTRGMPRPYYRPFHEAMWYAARYLCENIQGVQLAYVQSDEISLLLTDYATIKTEAWFDYQVQKMCSVAASMCSVAFNVAWSARSPDTAVNRLESAYSTAVFDCRVWNLPKDEVCNAFIWRQNDATRNSIQMAGQSQFSYKELHGVDCDGIQEMLHQQRGINWNDYPVPQKRGVCVVKRQEVVPVSGCSDGKEGCWVAHAVVRNRWIVDENIPIFTQDRDYIERRLVDTMAAS